LGCEKSDDLFIRESPKVNQAIEALRESKYLDATSLLESYLETGACESGVIGAGDRARQYGDAAFDLALAFIDTTRQALAESAEKNANASSTQPGMMANPMGQANPGGGEEASQEQLNSELECALRLLAPLTEDRNHSAALRGRASYLIGNLELLRSEFDAAIAAYDQALQLLPATKLSEEELKRIQALSPQEDANQSVKDEERKPTDDAPEENVVPESDALLGLMAAQNRALAQRLKEQQPPPPEEEKSNQDQQDNDKQDQQDQKDQKDNDQKDQQDNDQKQQAANSSSPSDSDEQEAQKKARDAQILDELEQAPTLQREQARIRAARNRRRPTMEDK
ncbi:MAG: hypothetical protein MK135_00170, partial [Polyangiaceae bacterium]|nr:hypothetical protein [Polyangiaceae bacterium]